MIKTEQPTKYDPSIDANIARAEYVLDNYGGLPNESMLEDQWEALPPAIEGKPLKHFAKLKAFLPGRPIRFYQNRLGDVTGISGTGKILTGVIMPTGRVFVEWLTQAKSVGIYNNFDEYYSVHVALQPDANEVVFID